MRVSLLGLALIVLAKATKSIWLCVHDYRDVPYSDNAKQRYLKVAGGAVPVQMAEFTVSESEIMGSPLGSH